MFIPAFTDSEKGLDVSTWAMLHALGKDDRDRKSLSPAEVFQAVPSFNPFLDLQEYARLIGTAPRVGHFDDRGRSASQLGSAGWALL